MKGGPYFKEGNKFAGQNCQASGKQEHFFQYLECPLLTGGVCLLFWKLVVMSKHQLVV